MQGESFMESKNRKKTVIIATVVILAVLALVLILVLQPQSASLSAAEGLRKQGKYVEADAMCAKLEQTDDVIELRRNLYYESRAMQCALLLKKEYNTNTLKIINAFALEPMQNQQTGQYNEPYVVIGPYEYTDSNKNVITGYTLFEGSSNGYRINHTSPTVDDTIQMAVILSLDGIVWNEQNIAWLNDLAAQKNLSDASLVGFNSFDVKNAAK